MRPHEDDRRQQNQGAQRGGGQPRRPPGEGQPPGHQQPPQRGQGGQQGAPPGGGHQQPQQQNPPGQAPPQQGPPQQWHEPPSPPSGTTQSGGAGGGGAPRQGSGGQMVQQPGPRGQSARPPESQPRTRTGLEPVTVDDIVETDVVTAERDTPIAEVVGAMASEDVGSVVVVDGDEPVGVLTDRTIALSLESEPDVSDREAGDLIGGDLVTGSTDMSVFEALQRLSDEGIRRLPIVDDEGTLEGIVTLDDVLVLLGTELGDAIDVIKDQSPRI